jgi:LuxR family maltose regulon positive regulatory protein
MTVNEAHNDPVSFWTTVTAAIGEVAPGFGATYESVLTQAGVRIHDVILPRLANELVDLVRPVTLVLDDLHVVSDPDVVVGLSWLVSQGPSNLRLVVTAREVSALPVSRLRAAGQLLEIDESILRFDRSEGAAVLDTICPGLDDRFVATAIEKTEGWPVGMVLLGMMAAAHSEPSAVLQGFDGRDRDVEHYLVEEVLDRMPADDRQWMRTTSVLNQLSEEACDAVTGSRGSGARLARLAAANSFIAALDRAGMTYQYHRLFAQCMQKRFRALQPESYAEAHRRACVWFQARGDVDASFAHAMSSDDLDLAADIATDSAYELMGSGRTHTVHHMVRRLGDEILARHPDLAMATAIATAIAGVPTAPAEVRRLLTIAADAADRSRLGGSAIRSMIELVGVVFTFAGVERARETSLRILQDSEPETRPSGVLICAAMSHYYSGRLAEAASYALEVLQEGGRGPGPISVASVEQITAQAMLATIATDQHDFVAARRWADRATESMVDSDLTESRTIAHTPLAQGRLHLRMGELDAAEPLIQRALVLAPTWSIGRIHALLELARLALERDDLAQVADLLEESGDAIADHEDAGTLKVVHRQLLSQIRPETATSERVALLTPREQEIVDLLPTGLTARQMAEQLYVSLHTVKSHLRSAYQKLGASSRSEAIAIASRLREANGSDTRSPPSSGPR